MGYVIQNCCITQTDSEIKKLYNVWDKEDVHTGIDIYAENVYSPCYGVVIQQCLVDHQPSVVIQYSEFKVIRFCHLNECYVNLNQLVNPNQLIGKADQFVHFEYLTPELPSHSPNALRVKPGVVFYMHDPLIVFQEFTGVLFNNNNISELYTDEENEKEYELYQYYVEKASGVKPGYTSLNSYAFDFNQSLR